MDPQAPFTDDESEVCWYCPSLRHPAGGFDVHPGPSPQCPFDPATGFRFTPAGVPVCVHPGKVGLPAARYATDRLPVPAPAPRRPDPRPLRAHPDELPPPPPPLQPLPTGATDAEVLAGARPEVSEGLLALLRAELANGADDFDGAIAGAERAATGRGFPVESVVEAMRRVLGGG
ncbi:hypothetical protein [Kitasatospora viridis]|uniref:Uncharacterized protein n=1 Tax=Kitasatospora viridis TaxID=281105 RepID=A0A561TTU1_9ACTN|nr:hypothetical protein [Kitasatospora viridis]TWF90484.1 hypothetical protein FHX73_13531 [Kitasatospora viridis]